MKPASTILFLLFSIIFSGNLSAAVDYNLEARGATEQKAQTKKQQRKVLRKKIKSYRVSKKPQKANYEGIVHSPLLVSGGLVLGAIAMFVLGIVFSMTWLWIFGLVLFLLAGAFFIFWAEIFSWAL